MLPYYGKYAMIEFNLIQSLHTFTKKVEFIDPIDNKTNQVIYRKEQSL